MSSLPRKHRLTAYSSAVHTKQVRVRTLRHADSSENVFCMRLFMDYRRGVETAHVEDDVSRGSAVFHSMFAIVDSSV